MRRSRAPSIAPGTFFVAQSWEGCITNMPGFDLRQAHGLIVTQRRLGDNAMLPPSLFASRSVGGANLQPDRCERQDIVYNR
jgi:hypothetical protein